MSGTPINLRMSEQSKSDAIIEFARTELTHIQKEQLYMGVLAIAIIGGVIPIFVSLLFQNANQRTIFSELFTNVDVAVIIIIALSFVYAFLSITYVTLSTHRSEVIVYLKYAIPEFVPYIEKHKSLENFDPLIDHNEKRKWRNRFIKIMWTAAKISIFVVPSISAMTIGYFYIQTRQSVSIYVSVFFYIVTTINLLIIIATMISWSINRYSTKKQDSPEINQASQHIRSIICLVLLILALVVFVCWFAKNNAPNQSHHIENFPTSGMLSTHRMLPVSCPGHRVWSGSRGREQHYKQTDPAAGRAPTAPSWPTPLRS